MKKLMKSKKGAGPLLLLLIPAIPWILGLTLFGVPIFGTWLKIVTTPAKPISPIWIIVIGFVVLILLIKRR